MLTNFENFCSTTTSKDSDLTQSKLPNGH